MANPKFDIAKFASNFQAAIDSGEPNPYAAAYDQAGAGVDDRRRFAAIDATDPISGAVYGLGSTPEAAIADARRGSGDATSEYRIVKITPAADAYVAGRGGAPAADLEVSRHGVSLRDEE